MAMEIRGDLQRKLTPVVLKRIQEDPKPTKTAEVVVVTKELGGMAVSLEEVAEIINIAEPGRDIKAKESDYSVEELKNHPDLLVVTTPSACHVRYT